MHVFLMIACTNSNYHVMVVFLFFVGTTVKFGHQPIPAEMGVLQVRDTALHPHFHACRIVSLSCVQYVLSIFFFLRVYN